MLKFEAYSTITNIQTGEFERMAVYNEFDELVAFIINTGKGYLVSSVGAPTFEQLAKDFGVSKTTIIK